MIPTSFKSKIPQTHFYPAGAELLSESSPSVPQFELLTLNFYGLWAKDKSNLQPVLKVNHINIRESQYSSKNLVAQGFYQDTWEIVIYPVPRERKAEVKRLLVAEGLLKVKEWLSAKRSPAWLEGRKTLSVSFDEGFQTLRYEEEGNM
jgi:hypothetical protein